MIIVTFSCSSAVHVYLEQTGVRPMFPYKWHPTIDAAKQWLKEKLNFTSIEAISVIVKK